MTKIQNIFVDNLRIGTKCNERFSRSLSDGQTLLAQSAPNHELTPYLSLLPLEISNEECSGNIAHTTEQFTSP